MFTEVTTPREWERFGDPEERNLLEQRMNDALGQRMAEICQTPEGRSMDYDVTEQMEHHTDSLSSPDSDELSWDGALQKSLPCDFPSPNSNDSENLSCWDAWKFRISTSGHGLRKPTWNHA